MKKLIIAVDFDNCITGYAQFPTIGKLRPEARIVINYLYESGHVIIINSCRTGESQSEAVNFLRDNGIKFHYFNDNVPSVIENFGGDTRKIHADIYVDDKNFGSLDWPGVMSAVTKLSKPTIICIVGESGSGKSTIADYIQKEYGIEMIESRTTRPERYAGENGHTFVSDDEFDSYKDEDKIAFTKFGDYRYCCLVDDVMGLSTYVIDEKGINYLIKNFSDKFNVYSLRIIASEEVRSKRVDKERMARDNGMFKADPFVFTHRIYTDVAKEDTFNQVDNAINDILINKLYSK